MMIGSRTDTDNQWEKVMIHVGPEVIKGFLEIQQGDRLEAELIHGERRGVEMRNTSRCAEIEQRFPGLIRAIVNAHAIQSEGEARKKKPVAKRPAKRPAAKK